MCRSSALQRQVVEHAASGFQRAPGSSSMATTMLTAMLIMTFAFWAYSIAAAMHRCAIGIIEREATLPGCATR